MPMSIAAQQCPIPNRLCYKCKCDDEILTFTHEGLRAGAKEPEGETLRWLRLWDHRSALGTYQRPVAFFSHAGPRWLAGSRAAAPGAVGCPAQKEHVSQAPYARLWPRHRAARSRPGACASPAHPLRSRASPVARQLADGDAERPPGRLSARLIGHLHREREGSRGRRGRGSASVASSRCGPRRPRSRRRRRWEIRPRLSRQCWPTRQLVGAGDQ